MVEVKEEKNIYLANFARLEAEFAQAGPAWLLAMRKAAIKRFAELGFPTARNEDWKFTSVAPLAKLPFRPVEAHVRRPVTAAAIEKLLPSAIFETQLVFVDGHYTPELSRRGRLPAGVEVWSLAEALRSQPERLRPHLAKYAYYQDDAFTALNTAFFRDGAWISVPKGVVVNGPIGLLFISTADGEGHVSHVRNLILADPNSQLTVVEGYFGLGERAAFTSSVTEIVTGENAQVDHVKLQQESEEAFHVANTQIQQEPSSRFTTHYVGFGGALVRNEVRVLLNGQGCEATVNGLYNAAGRQHMDNHTVIHHAHPHCASHELYKGILSGQAHGVFNGKIFVHQDAQKTDAKQTNQTLLLSDDAVINTKPQLEIYADDVKCTHGATVGQLEDKSIFYLRSRGIGLEEARALLTYAFANDIIGRIKIEPLREHLERVLLERQQAARAVAAGERR